MDIGRGVGEQSHPSGHFNRLVKAVDSPRENSQHRVSNAQTTGIPGCVLTKRHGGKPKKHALYAPSRLNPKASGAINANAAKILAYSIQTIKQRAYNEADLSGTS